MWLLIAVVGGFAAFFMAIGSAGGVKDALRQRLLLLESVTEEQLAAARIRGLTARRLTQLRVAVSFAGFVVAFAISQSVLVALLVAFVAGTVPRRWVARQRQQRLDRIEEQLPDAIDQLVSSVRAGLSLSQAVDETAASTMSPISEEFTQIRNEEKAGLPLPDAIDAARRRIGGRGFPLVAAALRVSLDKGGNLPEALQKISDSLKEIWRLEQKLITASAEARKAVRVISWMPVVIALMVLVLQPDLAATLTSTGLGWVILVAVAVMYGAGLQWLRKLIEPDV